MGFCFLFEIAIYINIYMYGISKIIKTILKKEFFCISSDFSSNQLCAKILEMVLLRGEMFFSWSGSYWVYKKIENFLC
jgi:hypothetical protein